MIKKTVKENKYGPMALVMKVNGLIIYLRAMALSKKAMAMYFKANGKKAGLMGLLLLFSIW